MVFLHYFLKAKFIWVFVYNFFTITIVHNLFDNHVFFKTFEKYSHWYHDGQSTQIWPNWNKRVKKIKYYQHTYLMLVICKVIYFFFFWSITQKYHQKFVYILVTRVAVVNVIFFMFPCSKKRNLPSKNQNLEMDTWVFNLQKLLYWVYLNPVLTEFSASINTHQRLNKKHNQISIKIF